MASLTREEFVAVVGPQRGVCVPVSLRVLSDQLTPVLAYRRLVAGDARSAPSFLLESVEGGERQGRYSIMGAQPVEEVVARGEEGAQIRRLRDGGPALCGGVGADPLGVMRERSKGVRLLRPPVRGGKDELPACFLGGWVGYAGYDSVRYAEGGKLPFSGAPRDDRGLADVHFAFYDGVVAFDHVDKVVHLVQLAWVGEGADPGESYDEAIGALRVRLAMIERHSKPLVSGVLTSGGAMRENASNITRETHAEMVARAKEYIRAGDIFQVVVGQRFERASAADPFDVYRALRAVNPSPYMVYMQCEGCILVASSPEILCRVRREGDGFVVTNRPLAGTRRRGGSVEEDAALERELLADEKERAEHIMLVDLGRNDVGVVAQPGTVRLAAVMEVERYSHVMHISSTVTGRLREGLDCWDALRAALPVGTISGAPKIRAMQVIDELEPVRRGPYGGGMGYVGLDGQMDIALALRTMVVPTAMRSADGAWVYHLQAAGGIVADSVAQDEYQETVNKAAALSRAIGVAERAFGTGG
jgi:anthranilate synthase component 1